MAVFFLAIIAPCLFTQFSSGINFGDPNEIGDTISGTTAPIIGIMGALLIYLTFEQQNKAIQQPIELKKAKVENIRKMIIFDLNNNIAPNLLKISQEIDKKLKDKENILKDLEDYSYYHFNTLVFDSIDKDIVFSAFGNKFIHIVDIYSSISFIKKNTLESYLRAVVEMCNDEKYVKKWKDNK